MPTIIVALVLFPITILPLFINQTPIPNKVKSPKNTKRKCRGSFSAKKEPKKETKKEASKETKAAKNPKKETK